VSDTKRRPKDGTDEGSIVTVNCRVRTILALGYWALGNICRYWVVLLLGDIFSLRHPIRYRSDSSQHRPRDNHLDVCGAAMVSRRQQGDGEGVECIVQAIHHHHTVLRFYMV